MKKEMDLSITDVRLGKKFQTCSRLVREEVKVFPPVGLLVAKQCTVDRTSTNESTKLELSFINFFKNVKLRVILPKLVFLK